MRSAVFVTACAITALAATIPAFAQDGGASFSTPNEELAPGYYVAADGAIEYRDPTQTDIPLSPAGSPPSVEPIDINALPMVDIEPVFIETVEPGSAVFDAPIESRQTAVTLESSPAFETTFQPFPAPEAQGSSTSSYDPVLTETVTVDSFESAPIFDAPTTGDTVSVTSGSVVDIDATAGPQTITIEVDQPDYIITEEIIDGGGSGGIIQPSTTLSSTGLPVTTARLEPSYSSGPLPHSVGLAPMGFPAIAQGDGQYGPSDIDRGGESLAARDLEMFISKSAIVKLPVGASEIVIADPGVVRAELRTDRQSILYGTRVGSTNAFFLDENGNQILNLEINVRYDLRPLRAALARTFPDTPVSIDTVLGEVIVSADVGDVSAATDIASFVRRYLVSAINGAGGEASFDDVQIVERFNVDTDDQVLLKVRVAEIKRNVVKQFGVNWSVTDGPGAFSSGPTGLGNFASSANPFPVNGTVLGGVAANLSASIGAFSFGSLIQAFEQHNVIRILAEPTLTAVSGETASFLAGGEFPFPVSVDDGEVGFDFRDFGVALEFTPVVVGDGRISLRIATEVSELTNEGALTTGDVTIPGLSVRRANTTVELASGGTMSIAGLLQQRDAATNSGLPGVKNVPVLGRLFSSSDYRSAETELVILVTPYVVGQAREQDFRLPTDGFAPASDMDFYLLGQINKVYGAGERDETAARKMLEAPIGFILE